MRTEVLEFLKQFPEYNTDKFTVESIDRKYFDGDFIILVYINDDEYGFSFYCSYWCKEIIGDVVNGEQVKMYIFEKEKEVSVLYLDANIYIDTPYAIYYHNNEGDERDYSQKENFLIEQFMKDNEQKIREEIAKKILSGEIELRLNCHDSDSFDAPHSKLGKIYNL